MSIGRVLLVGLAAIAAVELALEAVDGRAREQAAARATPTYSRALFTSSGDRLTPHDGILRLRLTPFRGVAAEPGIRGAMLNTNSLGLRAPEVGPKTPGRPRVLLSGGSTAFGSGLAGDDLALAAQLAKRLPGDEFLTLAIDAYTSGHELSTLVFLGLSLEPDAVVSLSGWNDYYQLRQGQVVPEYEAQIEDQLAVAARVADPNVPRRWMNGVVLTFFPALASRVTSWLPPNQRAATARRLPVGDPERSAKGYVENVVHMARIAQAAGARFLAVLQPDRCEMDVRLGAKTRDGCLPEFSSGYTRFRELAFQGLRRAGVRVIDLGDSDRDLPPEVFTDPIHLTEDGYRRLADLLAPRISELLAEPASAEPR